MEVDSETDEISNSIWRYLEAESASQYVCVMFGWLVVLLHLRPRRLHNDSDDDHFASGIEDQLR